MNEWKAYMEEYGKVAWDYFHLHLDYWTQFPPTKRDVVINFVHTFTESVPCSVCRDDFRTQCMKHPINFNHLTRWGIMMHDLVNYKLDKPLFATYIIDEGWVQKK